MQQDILEIGCRLLESAFFPRTTLQTPYVWDEVHTWRQNYLELTPDRLEELARLGAERRAQRQLDRQEGKVRS